MPRGSEDGIAAEDLVRPLANQHDLDSLVAALLVEQARRDSAPVGKQIVEIPHEVFEAVHYFAMIDQNLPMVRPDVLGHRTGEGALVDRRFRESHADGRYARVARRERRDDARIEPTGQQEPYRHVGDQMLTHDLRQRPVQVVDYVIDRALRRAAATRGAVK